LGRTRGNRGELTGEIYSSKPGRAEQLREVRLEKNGASREFLVERVWHHDGRPVLKFEGVDSISSAEALAGSDILVRESERALPGPGEFSHADLIGCELIAQSGQRAGVVRAVEDYGGSPLLEIETDDGRSVLVPFARSICTEIDVARKVIRANLPEGLTEL
jgi:16S rRNA processing protein RimM